MGTYPAYVVNTTTTEQVRIALKWAKEKNVRIVIKSTGHSIAGRSVGAGSLSIWTHYLRGIEYTADFTPSSCAGHGTFEAARIAAGHTGIDVLQAMAKQGKVAITGANPSVGIVGWMTGGGHGPLAQTYGMGVDHLLEATIVTSDGELLVTNPCQQSDLFFAIRGGGGGTFGVVTEVVVRVYPSPQTTRHSFSITSFASTSSTEFYSLMGFVHAELQRLKDGGMQGYYYIAGPPIVRTLSFMWTF
jgi:FAD/FMN-containing dehydrogenase